MNKLIQHIAKRWQVEGVKYRQAGKGLEWIKTLRTADCALCSKCAIEEKENQGFINWGLLIHELDATGRAPEICSDCMKEISGDIIPAPRFAECPKCKVRQREKIYGVGWPGWKQLIIPTRQSREIIRNLICPNCVLELARKLGEKYIRGTWTALTYSAGSLLTSTKMTENQANIVEAAIGRDNLCKNATFGWRSLGTSAVPDKWTLEGSPTVAYDTVDTGYGDYAVKLTATGADDEGINQTITNLKASAKYQVFARVKVTAGDTASLITTGGDTNIDSDSTSATWENITGEFVTDASGTDVVIKLVASAATDVAYFCGITCVEGDAPETNFIRRIDENIGDIIIKAWIQFDGTGTIAIQDSFNVSGIGDDGTGDYLVSWETNFANDDYSVVVASNTFEQTIRSLAAGNVAIETSNAAGAALDAALVFAIAIGDQ